MSGRDGARIHEEERDEVPVVAPPEPSPAERVAGSVGNRAFGQMIGRVQGDGILPGGAVHPDVAATIASANGSGHELDTRARDRLSEHVGDPLTDVRVHTDTTADELARSVSARAFTTGTDVYFAEGEYRPGTSDGDSLLAHELTHVVQQRGAPTGGPLTVSEPGDAMETEAESVARGLGG